MLYVVYKIKNKTNDKIYIGITNNLHLRWKNHQRNAFINNMKMPLYASMRKYGIDNFEINVIDSCADTQLLLEKEKEYIKNFKLEGYTLYNLTDGGEGCWGYKHTESAKRIMSIKKKGIKFTEEKRSKLLEFYKNNTHKCRILDFKYYENNPLNLSKFKIKCKKEGWDFNKFKPTLHHRDKKGIPKYLFFYDEDYDISTFYENRDKKILDEDKYRNIPTPFGNFKRACKSCDEDYLDFEKIEVIKSVNSKPAKYIFIRKQ